MCSGKTKQQSSVFDHDQLCCLNLISLKSDQSRQHIVIRQYNDIEDGGDLIV